MVIVNRRAGGQAQNGVFRRCAASEEGLTAEDYSFCAGLLHAGSWPDGFAPAGLRCGIGHSTQMRDCDRDINVDD
jgi:hypothetical protein